MTKEQALEIITSRKERMTLFTSLMPVKDFGVSFGKVQTFSNSLFTNVIIPHVIWSYDYFQRLKKEC